MQITSDEDSSLSESEESAGVGVAMTSDTDIRSNPLVSTILIFLFTWQFIYKVSNTGISVLIRFIKALFHHFGQHYHCEVADCLPLSLKKAQKICQLYVDNNQYKLFCVCKSCQSLFPEEYFFDQASTSTGKVYTQRLCPFMPLPKRVNSQPMQCNRPLLEPTGGRGKLKMPKIFCYQSIGHALQKLARRDLLNDCEHWRHRNPPADTFSDVYDGNIWKEFSDFVSVPFSLLLCLNVDWFQPFKHLTYSVGAVYLSILNLPRHKRNKMENIILVGIIPGPREPHLTLNSYLTPLVTELKELWIHGVKVQDSKGAQLTVRVALACVNCDIPASRKVCGFPSHNARLGCNKCYKPFTFNAAVPSKTDYSGYDRENWVPRSNERHRRDCKKLESEKTARSLQVKESMLGVRNSVLLSLPYFDAIKHCALDPMHNLFMGTGKACNVSVVGKGYPNT